MHMAVYSNERKPDVAVYTNILILIVEVHSCTKGVSFPSTIRKLILGVPFILFHNCDSLKGLVAPKFGTKKCALEVTVRFSNCKFQYIEIIEKDEFAVGVFAENKEKLHKITLTTSYCIE